MANLKKRLVNGLAATALNPLATAIIQFGTVPLFLHVWGPAKYGDWLLLSAIPSYLTFTNMGIGDASGSDMTVRVAAGDRLGALETFQSLWVLMTSVSLLALAIISLAIWWVPWKDSMHLSSMSNHSAAQVLFVLGVYVIIGQQTGLLESGFKCDGNYPLGAAGGTLMRFVEQAGGCLAGVLTGSILLTAVAALLLRCVGILAYGSVLYYKSRWLRIGFRSARRSRLRELMKPAFGFAVMPLGYAISLQGFTLIIGAMLGPIAVTAFSTLRTMARVNYQLMTVIAWSVWPEISTAFGSGDLSLARRLHRRAYQAGLALSVLSATGLWLAGPYLYRIWIHSAVAFDVPCFHILLLVTVVNSLWFISSVVPMSTNVHHPLAVIFLIASCVSLGVATVLIPRLGISGAAWALLLVDLTMLAVVLRMSLKQLNDSFGSFLRSLVHVPSALRLARSAMEA